MRNSSRRVSGFVAVLLFVTGLLAGALVHDEITLSKTGTSLAVTATESVERATNAEDMGNPTPISTQTLSPQSLTDEPQAGITESSATMGEMNALASAIRYLNVTPFSYSGLVHQLEFEGYSHSEAVFGADNCGADWYEQAAKSAIKYLSHMSFSRTGLIEQLEYEGYTNDQAVYGVTQAGY